MSGGRAAGAIDQFVAALTYGDAVGNHVLALRNLFTSRSVDSAIFFGSCNPVMESEGALFTEYDPISRTQPAAILYHLSIGSPVADFLLSRHEDVMIDYHDMTPAEYFSTFDPIAAELVEQGHWQLEAFSDRTKLAWAHSEFARADLEKAGFRHTAVAPILIDFEKLERPPDAHTLRWLRDTKGSGPDILFVGRVAPNKRHDDLIKLARLYPEITGRHARVFCVGELSDRLAPYLDELRWFAREVGVDDHVVFTGAVDLSVLRAYYAACDVYVSLSEHEGFGVPLVEAMRSDLPVVAYDAGAVGETIGSGGIVVPNKDLVEFAVAIDLMHTDGDAANTVRAAGRRRAAEFEPGRVASRYAEMLALP